MKVLCTCVGYSSVLQRNKLRKTAANKALLYLKRWLEAIAETVRPLFNSGSIQLLTSQALMCKLLPWETFLPKLLSVCYAFHCAVIQTFKDISEHQYLVYCVHLIETTYTEPLKVVTSFVVRPHKKRIICSITMCFSLNPARQTFFFPQFPPPPDCKLYLSNWIHFIQSKTPFVCMAVRCSICPRMSNKKNSAEKNPTSPHHFGYLIWC